MFTRLTSQSELPALNQAKEFPCDDNTICVANVNGEISAMDNICLHRGGPLGQGVISGGKVVCPWHGWEWDPKTGKAGPPGAKIAVYPVKIEGGDVLIEVQKLVPSGGRLEDKPSYAILKWLSGPDTSGTV